MNTERYSSRDDAIGSYLLRGKLVVAHVLSANGVTASDLAKELAEALNDRAALKVANDAANDVLGNDAVSLVGLQAALRGAPMYCDGPVANAWLREVAKRAVAHSTLHAALDMARDIIRDAGLDPCFPESLKSIDEALAGDYGAVPELPTGNGGK